MSFKGDNSLKEEWKYNKKHYSHKPTIVLAIQVYAPFTVDTLEGKMHGKRYDYLVQGTKGEFYSVDRKIFEEIYDEIYDEVSKD